MLLKLMPSNRSQESTTYDLYTYSVNYSSPLNYSDVFGLQNIKSSKLHAILLSTIVPAQRKSALTLPRVCTYELSCLFVGTN